MLIIFIDALPSSKKFKIENLKTAKLAPNLGYSVNLHNEIFNGKTPDQMGFFGEYLFCENPTFFKKLIFNILNLIEFAPFKLNYLFKIFLRRFFKIKIGQIPFKLVPYFKREGKYPFINECPSILDKFKKFVTDDLKTGLGKRDNIAIHNVLNYLKKQKSKKNIFVSLCDLDGIGHKYGTDSNEYSERLDFLKIKCELIIEQYSLQFPEKPVIVLSDHGMSNVKHFIDPKNTIAKLQKEFNAKCFYDSLYLQVYIKENNQSNNLLKIKELISKELPVHIFNEHERMKYGITNTNFGSVICLLNNNLAFSPNLFGYIKMKAYHGYLPNNDDNHGIFLSVNINQNNIPKVIRSLDVHELIANLSS